MKEFAFVSILLLLGSVGPAQAQEAHAQEKKPTRYPAMAPADQYLMATAQDEIALARTAAPPSISADADVLVLGKRGYETAVKGKNGFVCFVERAWTASFDDEEFWNPKSRAPNCFNPPAVRSVLPQYIKRSEWVMSGATREQLIDKVRAALASHQFVAPEPGSFSYMLSKQGYLGDGVSGPWLPHLMFFVEKGQAAAWGAGTDGSPILGGDKSPVDLTILLVPVRRWSDGSPGPAPDPVKH
jgi:hypothetical protein